ncbi:MAG: PQQ-dependent sugar dehydrogenase [Anaerolineales bacterium]|nr:PQQ-dependent sugar dehydrogenase [Anaerolineales bacterium]
MPRPQPQITWLCALLLAAACGPGAAPVQPVALHTATPTVLTATDSPTATRAPALTPTPTRTTGTPVAPTATPTELGQALTPTIPVNTVVERGALPPGFSLTVYGDAPRPTSLAFGPDGALYAASALGVVYALRDADGDHRAETRTVFANNLPVPLGLLWVTDALYVSYNGAVVALRDEDSNDAADSRRVVVSGLPSGGLHQNDGLALGADGFIYLGQGSTCDHCRQADARSGTILRFKPDGTDFSVFATGMRNPYDLAFNAVGELFATDNGRDDLGWDAPPEELNHVRAGRDYGWPDCWTGNTAGLCATREQAVAVFTPHKSANGLAFYHGRQFPAEYFDNAFVAVLGSINLRPADAERGVRRVQLTRQGDTYVGATSLFLDLPDGRPLDVTVGPDGALYVADYINDVVYRIVYGAP